MMGIRDKLLLVIGDCSINQWARDHELPPQTVHGWIDKDRVPRKGGMETLVKATGIPEKWWLYGEGQPPTVSKLYPVSKATALTLKSPEPAHIVTVIDTQTMIFVMVSVDALITKKGINIDPVKKAELILLIYDYCKGTGICNEDIVAKFLKLAG